MRARVLRVRVLALLGVRVLALLALGIAQAAPLNCGAFGAQVYESNLTAMGNDWTSTSWDGNSTRSLTSAGTYDPQDDRNMMKGSGTVTLGNGECRMAGSPRLYTSSSPPFGWSNVEFTAYGRWLSDGSTGDPPVSTLRSYSGLTLVARTNHGDYADGCSAAGYYARVYRSTGQVALQKEYFHDTSGTMYTSSKRVSDIPQLQGGLPDGLEVGIKFVVLTAPPGSSSSSDVRLEVYLDFTGGLNGGTWSLAHSFTDTPGAWTTSKEPLDRLDNCGVGNGDTVLGARKYCFLRTDGAGDVRWSKASIRHVTTTKTSMTRSGSCGGCREVSACGTGCDGEQCGVAEAGQCTNSSSACSGVGEQRVLCCACPAGQFKDVAGSGACKACTSQTTGCAAGSYLNDLCGGSSSGCLNCPNHSSSPIASAGVSACLADPGFTGPNGGVVTPCAAGTYKADSGESLCSVCPAHSNSSSAAVAASACICLQGYSGFIVGTSNVTSGSCTEIDRCESGEDDCSAQATCISTGPGEHTCACNGGFFGSGISCGACPDHSSSLAASVSITACIADPGYTGPDGGEMIPCSANQYKVASGSAACSECFLHSSTGGDTGASAASDCRGEAGYSGSGSNVVACLPGTYKENGASSAACTMCGADTWSSGHAQSSSGACQACPFHTGVSSQGSDEKNDCVADPGFTGPNGGVVTPCAAGTYKADRGEGSCSVCSSGTSSDAGSSVCVAVVIKDPVIEDPVAEDAVVVDVSMTGDGLWRWVSANMNAFKQAFVKDTARIMGVDETAIVNVLVTEEDDGLLLQRLLSDQTVHIRFTVSKNASSSHTPSELGHAFKESVNSGEAQFKLVESESGVAIEAEVTGVSGSSANVVVHKQAANGFWQSPIQLIGAGVLVLCCCFCLAAKMRSCLCSRKRDELAVQRKGSMMMPQLEAQEENKFGIEMAGAIGDESDEDMFAGLATQTNDLGEDDRSNEDIETLRSMARRGTSASLASDALTVVDL